LSQVISYVLDSLNRDLMIKESGLAFLLSRIKNNDVGHTFSVLVDTKNNGNFCIEVKELNESGEIYFSTYFRKVGENKKFLNLTGRKGILFLCVNSGYRKEYVICNYNNMMKTVKEFTKMSVDVIKNSKSTDMKFLDKIKSHPFFKLTLNDLITV